ncbi:hypothetical protein ACFL20_02165 [Spirochaetota bacterium]
MKNDEDIWLMIKNHLGYSDEEMKLFKENPKNRDILSKIPEILNTTLTFEVIESNGCNSQHMVGDKFIFDGAGNLLTAKNPKRICIYALQAMLPVIFAGNELVYAGVNPNEIRFKRAGCFDVGVKCGGWGRIVVEFKAEQRNST